MTSTVEWVLITAAAGGMGTLLVQLAAAAGGKVVGAARGERKLDAVRSFGGSVGEAAFGVTADGGQFSNHGAAGGGFAGIDPERAAARGIRVRGIQDVQLSPERMRELLARALASVAAGRLEPHVGAVFPLEKAADAHAALESRVVAGKALLIP